MRLACFIVLGWLWMATAEAATNAGNAWHVPGGGEPGIASMRSPVHGNVAGADVQIFSGNQFAGTGNVGNQLQTGSAVVFRKLGDATWSALPLTFHSQAGNNKYFVATIPGAMLAAGDAVEYYLKIAYSDHPTTFVFGSDDRTAATLDEAVAQAGPFAFAIDAQLSPVGAFAASTDGAWQTRVYTASGHIALVGPTPDAIAVALAPPQAKVGGNWLPIGRVVEQTAIPGGLELRQELGPRTIRARLSIAHEGVLRYEVIDWGGAPPTETQFAGAAEASEHFYGFGEKFNALDQAGKIVRVVTSDFAGDKGDHSYKVAPWFISSRGYGVHLDATAESVFDMRATRPDRFAARLALGTLAVNLVGGPSTREVLSRYTGYAGRAPLPPPWVFGTWMSTDAWRDGGEVRYVVGKLVANKVPGSVFVFDSPWERGYNDLTWNTTQFAAGGTYEGQRYDGFASLAEMMTFLRTNGFKVVVWLTPFLNTRSNDEGVPGQNTGRVSTYDEAAAKGYLVRQSPNGPPLVVTWWKGEGSAVDFTNPAARAWFQQQLQALVDESGDVIAGFKTDDGEADYIPPTASYADGRTGVEMKNGYCVEYLSAVWNVLGPDGVVFARSGFTGTTAFPAVWAGDNEPNFGTGNGLPSVVQAGLSSAMSGYAIWGSDIGGYLDVNPSSEPADLFQRWTQFGALSPVMQLHRQVGAGMQYPWSYGDAAFAHYKAYARLHTQLFPYLYTHAKQASVDGTPLIRPLPLVESSDAALANSDEYMLGGDLLVAPVIEKSATGRSVYLPAGAWFDYTTNEYFEGGQTIAWTSADPARMPLFVRAGAIVPRISPDTQTLNDASYVGNAEIRTPDGSLDFLVYPNGSSHVVVHDGTDVTCDVDGDTTSLALTSSARTVTFAVYSTAHPVAVQRDGAALPELAPGALDEGWSYDGVFVHVQLAHAGGTTRLVLSGTAGPDDGDEAPTPAGCGCASDDERGPGAGWLLLLVACAYAATRRR